MEEPTLYILCGLPFSGKTILTKKLAGVLDYEIVNIDDIKFAHGFQWTDDDRMTESDWKRIFDESYEMALKNLGIGKSVLYDCANQDRAARDELRKVAAKGNFPTKVIWLDIPIETIKSRYIKNKETKERFDLPERIFQAALDTYEPPTIDEDVYRFDGNVPVELWIEKIFNFVPENVG